MQLDRAVAELSLADSRDLLALDWGASQRTMPVGQLDFLFPAFVGEACRGVFLPDEVTDRALAAARRVAANPALQALAWHCHWCLYRSSDDPDWSKVRLPWMPDVLEEATGMFYLLVLLSWFPQMRSVHESHSLPEQVVRDSMDQIYQRGVSCGRQLGSWGLDAGAARWLSNYLRGEIYALGRLAHQFWGFEGLLRVYRHAATSKVIALSDSGVSYSADGQLCRDENADRAWTARLRVTDDEIVGHPILPTGRAAQEDVHLPTAEWRQVLGRGDPILYFHIPGGSPLDHEECGASFRDAMSFFPRYFPERPFRAIYCQTWLLDTQLEEWLSPTSNLVRFLREFYLFPGGVSEDVLWGTVFGGRPADLGRAPRGTTLQRAVLDRVVAGRSIAPRACRCFLFQEDFDWGRQVYRSERFPWGLVGEG